MDKVAKETRSRMMARIHSTGNRSTEQRLRMLLVKSGLSGWRVLPQNVIGNPDFIFPNICLAIFVDGCYWHGCPKCGHIPKTNVGYWKWKIGRNKARDARLRAKLRRQGWSVLRIWEHEFSDPDRIISRISDALQK